MNEQHIKKLVVPNELLLKEADTYLKKGKKVSLYVRGTSMMPFLKEGDEVVLVSPYRTSVRKGNIVLAHTLHYGYVLHRVIGRKKDLLVLAGDANARRTETVVNREVLGVVEEAYRNGSELHINGLLKRLASLVWIFIRPFGAYILGGYRKINKIVR